ncbi:RNA polymerase sigma 70 [Curtobacterium sp. ER1/6]|nr:RNA polymerase sigma 70 [Curtobacterium sp. ER1/6]
MLARRHGPLMRVYAEQVLGSNDEADDVVQESFLTCPWRTRTPDCGSR